MINKVINNFKIEKEIDEGGMGSVYFAKHVTLNKQRAIKILHLDLSKYSEVLGRFNLEAKTLDELRHPNIVRIHDTGEFENRPYIAMDYLQGSNLSDYIKKISGPIPEEKAISMFVQMLDAIEFAHSKGVIHRDIKPSNFFVIDNKKVITLDFGVAKILSDDPDSLKTKTGQRIGSLQYMSPEQVKGQAVKHSTDIYSLGTTLFNMLTGTLPYNETELTEWDIQNEIVKNPLPSAKERYPYISDKMQAIIEKATQKEPADRYQTCKEFKDEINAINGKNNSDITEQLNQMIVDFAADGIITKSEELALKDFGEKHSIDYQNNILPLLNIELEKVNKVEFENNEEKVKATEINIENDKTKIFHADTDNDKTTILNEDTSNKNSFINKIKEKFDNPESRKNIITSSIVIASLILLTVLSIWIFGGETKYYATKGSNGLLGYVNTKGELVIDYQFYKGYDFKEEMAIVGLNGLYTYINLDGEKITDFEFSDAYDFKEGLALVSKNGKYGFINKNGEIVIDIQYDFAESFSEGLSVIRQDEKYGYINKSGEIVIDVKLQHANSFFDDRALIINKKGLYGYINKNGETEIEANYIYAQNFSDNLALVAKDDKFGYINTHGELIVDYKYSNANSFDNNLAIVEEKGEFYYINTDGEQVSENTYIDANNFYENNRAIVTNSKGSFIINPDCEKISNYYLKIIYTEQYNVFFATLSNGKQIVLNNNGEEISLEYSEISNFYEGMARVRQKNSFGFINYRGEEIIEPKYYQVREFDRNFGFVHSKCGYKVINKKGEFLINDLCFENIAIVSANKIFAAQKDAKWAYINIDGENITDYIYDGVSYIYKNIASVKTNNKYNFIEFEGTNGNFSTNKFIDDEFTEYRIAFSSLNLSLIKKNKQFYALFKDKTMSEPFDDVESFHENIFIIEKNNKFAIADTNFNFLTDYIYDDIDDFENGLAIVEKDDKFNYLNKKGKLISSTWFDDIDDFDENRAKVKIDKHYGFLNTDGDLIIKCKYKYASAFRYGIAIVKNDDDKYSLINTKGENIGAWHDYISYEASNLYSIEQNSKNALMNKEGKLISSIELKYIGNFNKGVALAKKDDKYGYINRKGDFIIKPEYEYGSGSFSNGIAVIELNNYKGYILRSGKVIVQPQYKTAKPFYSKSYAKVTDNNKANYIKRNGELVSNTWFDDIEYLEKNIFKIKENGKYKIIDAEGEDLSSNYSKIDKFKNGIAKVKLNGLYGFINLEGKEIVKAQYSKADNFYNGLVQVEKSNKEAYINETDDVILGWYQKIYSKYMKKEIQK